MSTNTKLTATRGGTQVKLTAAAFALVGMSAPEPTIIHSEGVCAPMRADTPHGYRVYLPLMGKMPIPGGTMKMNAFNLEGWNKA